jgi:hypothetical protein
VDVGVNETGDYGSVFELELLGPPGFLYLSFLPEGLDDPLVGVNLYDGRRVEVPSVKGPAPENQNGHLIRRTMATPGFVFVYGPALI